MTTIQKLIILDNEGILATLADGEIINAGGTSSSTWTVNGKGLLFDDGSSTSGALSIITLQSVYNNSPTTGPLIKLSSGKDFIIADDTNDDIYFSIDSETGKVTVTGDLEVIGNSTIINTVVQDSDHWLISPKNGSTTALRIEPDLGVTPFVDLLSVRRTFGSAPVFRIASSGDLISTQNIYLDGLLNGVDIVQLHSNFENHLNGSQSRHDAKDIDVSEISTLPNITNVQVALERLNEKVDGKADATTIAGYEHIQNDQALVWVISHNRQTIRSQTAVYDENMEQIIPDQIRIMDANNIRISFSTPVAGKAFVLLF